MQIDVGKDWRIKSTADSWHVERLKAKDHVASRIGTAPAWTVEAWCSTAADAMQYLFQHRVRAIPGSDCEKILDEIEKIRSEIRAAWAYFDEAPVP